MKKKKEIQVCPMCLYKSEILPFKGVCENCGFESKEEILFQN
jgi:hypothetical protein